MIPLKVIAEYKLFRNEKIIDSDRKEIIFFDGKTNEEEKER